MKIKLIKYILPFATLIILSALYLFTQKQGNNKYQTTNTLVQINESDIVIGYSDAPAKMLIYFSYSSSGAREFFNNIYPTIKKNYIDKGKLALIIRMVEIYENRNMMLAEQVAICLHKFGKLDAYNELLLYNPDVVNDKEFIEMVDGYMFDNVNIANCILDNEYFPDIKMNNEEFYKMNIKSIPLFIMGNKMITEFKSEKEIINLIEKNINN